MFRWVEIRWKEIEREEFAKKIVFVCVWMKRKKMKEEKWSRKKYVGPILFFSLCSMRNNQVEIVLRTTLPLSLHQQI